MCYETISRTHTAHRAWHHQDLNEGKKKLGKAKKQGSKPVLGVDLFRCFLCQKEGRSPPLRKCTQCEVAYYCGRDCQRAHWQLHKPACIAAVAAKAQDAARQRLARAVREKGADNVEGAEEDTLCVICQDRPVDPVEVSPGSLSKWSRVLSCKGGYKTHPRAAQAVV